MEKPAGLTGPTAVCIDLTCFKAEYAPGVSDPNPVSGFSENEMQDILLDLIEQERDNLFAITEFNPAIEKFKTCEVIINIFDTLIQGWLKNITETRRESLNVE